jgi:CheY-like chemotaxis protein
VSALVDGGAQANVLVADDHPENIFALREILESLGHNVVGATSGEEVLRALLHDEFAVILLDVRMPTMDGYETANAIKAREKTRHVPIIFLTAVNQDPGDVVLGYSAGAIDYLTKPVEPWLLRAKVAAFVNLYLEQKRLADLSLALSAAEQRRDHALQLNEGIVQGLAVAKMAIELGDVDRAADALERTLQAAKRVMNHLLLDGTDGAPAPGDLRTLAAPDA